MFKRSVTLESRDDTDLAAQAAVWGKLHEFGDMTWLPRQGKVIYRRDNRVPVSTPGDGLNHYPGFRIARASEKLEKKDDARCVAAPSELHGQGFTNNGSFFTGYPVVGFQNRIQASGMSDLASTWDPRNRGSFHHWLGFSIALSKAPQYIAEVQQLRDLDPCAFSGLDANLGVLLRYVRASTAYLGKSEDSLDFDITYYGSSTHADVVDEMEQLALSKYGAVPHWGKNRNRAFNGAIAKYPKAGEFLKVKARYDPDGIFSSEWSDQVLGIDGSPTIVGKGCAMEGLCVCSHDSHCAPDKGYSCQPGKVFGEARVCSTSIPTLQEM